MMRQRFCTDWFELPYQGISDKRLGSTRHVESDFPLRQFASLAEWEHFRQEARESVRTSLGLWPEQPACPLQAKRFGVREFQGYGVEKVLFESLPGLYVTGCLYWPAGERKHLPMILNPHGHWDEGRFEMSEVTRIPQRCVNFALHGMASFSFDMVGFGDSRQLPHEGYAGYALDLWNESLLSLQIHNCLRALDFVWELDAIDRTRIGSTGASGGGTQTFFLTALDDRVAVSMPVNMISTTFQGSCVCEYATNLHTGLSNIEIAALMAPRPMMLAGSSGDWTYELPTVTYPWLREIYGLYGKADDVACDYREGPHGYQTGAQEAAYRWFAEKLMGKTLTREEAAEKPLAPGTLEAVRLFAENAEMDLPPLDYPTLFQAQKARKMETIRRMQATPQGLASLRKALAFAIGDTEVVFARMGVREERQHGVQVRRELLESSQGAQLPLVTLLPEGGNGKVVFFAGRHGKARLIEKLRKKGHLDRLLQAGYAVCCADLFLTGEYIRPFGADGRDFSRPAYQWCSNQYATTYNYTDTAYRLQDYLGLYRYLQGLFDQVIPAGTKGTSAWVQAALPFLPGVREACGDLSSFDENDDQAYVEAFFLPGFLHGGGFETCRRLSGGPLVPLGTLLQETPPKAP